jgi:hypothetical protein
MKKDYLAPVTTENPMAAVRPLKVLAIAALILALVVVGAVIYLIVTPGDHEARYSSIEVGMSEKQVQDIMGSEGDSTLKNYRIAGDNRQRVWLVKERGQRLEIVVVFDTRSRVVAKDIYKSSLIVNYILKDV